MSDKYVKVETRYETHTQDAFLIETPFGSVEWIPFSLIGTIDERRIKSTKPGETVSFNLREWKAMQLGFGL